jgi:EmrB/QacA subfamily drug resistance transporter
LHFGEARRYLIFGIVALTILMMAMNITVVVVALPEIAEGLNSSLSWVGWILTGFQLAMAVSMPLAGGLGDQFGRKRMFLIAVALFTVSALGAGLSSNIALLIMFRIIMAVGGGAFFPIAAGIISEEFPNHRAQAIGLFSSIFPIGAIIGPNLGGILIQALSWRWAFFINVPVGVLVFALSIFLLRQSESHVQHHLDVKGAMLLGSSILTFMLALTLLGGDYGVPKPIIWSLLPAGGLIIALFWRHERRVIEPIIDLDLLRMRPFAASNVFNIFFGAFVFGAFAFIPLFTVMVFGFSTLESGVVLTGRGIGMGIASTATSLFLLKRFGYRSLITLGMLAVAVSLAWLGVSPNTKVILGFHFSDFWLLTVILSLSGIGLGIVNPPSNNAGIEIMPSKVSSITGLRGMFRSVGGVISTTIILYLLSVYDDQGDGLRDIFLVMALLTLITIPLILLMPTGREESIEKEKQPIDLEGV